MHSTVVGITLSWGFRLIIVLQMYTGIEHLSNWMVGGGNLVSLCWSRRLQIRKKRLEWSMGQQMRVGDTSLNSVSLTCRYSQSHVEIVYRQVQTHGLLHMHISLWRLSGLRSKDTPVTTSTCSTQILVFNTILQQKEPRLNGEMADSRTGARDIQDGAGCIHTWDKVRVKFSKKIM